MVGELLLGCYRVDALLGRGGMATVWRCTDIESKRVVAVKRLKNHADSARGLLEGEVMAAVRHESVIRLLDFGLEGGSHPCLVMELVRGEGLRQHLDRVGNIPWTQAFELGARALEGLLAVHDAGFLHRDVKPANIMLPSGLDGPIKLIDLGIVTPRIVCDPRLTQRGTAIGTPGYMAPELLMGLVPDVSADIYSMGTVIWEAICGKRPASVGLEDAQAKMRFRPDFAALPTGSPSLPSLAQHVLARMLRPTNTERVQDAGECACLLRSAVASALGGDHVVSSRCDTIEIEIEPLR